VKSAEIVETLMHGAVARTLDAPPPGASPWRPMRGTLGRWVRAIWRYHRWPWPTAPRMTRVCSWCQTVLEWGGPTVTHTICETCVRTQFGNTPR
jgi:hypothetical protein